ncbi:MAG: hypothetical protein OEU50_19105 [Gammaproteobacteria bacterium]|nr:hypothetical protein [Gammaproteobacteria bacterium]
MNRDPKRERGLASGKSGKGLPIWFKLAALILPGLIALKAIGIEVLVELTYDGIPFIAALTDIRIYFVPLLLILIYILSAWIWKNFSGSGDP